MATTRRPEPEVKAPPVVRPVMRDGRPHCPRCGGGLHRDYEGLTCIACGYEFTAPASEPQWRRLLDRRSAAAVWPLALTARLSPWVLVAGLAILAVPTIGRWIRQRRERQADAGPTPH